MWGSILYTEKDPSEKKRGGKKVGVDLFRIDFWLIEKRIERESLKNLAKRRRKNIQIQKN